MNILELHHDLSAVTGSIETTTKAVITKLLDAQRLNAGMQKKHEAGSSDWHMHETIDDRIHDALSLLGD